jgi:hypothetical protein
VEALPIAAQDELGHILCAVETAMQSGISHGRRITAAAYHRIWAGFCQQYHLEPDLRTSPDPIPWLQIFADSVRTGRISASGHSVRSGTVADAVCFVAQTFTLLGKRDPRFTPGTTTIDIRLARQLKGYAKCDAPPSRVNPIPLAVLTEATALALAAGDPISAATIDMLWIAFFFLLRPGEYTCPNAYAHPFRFQDVQLWCASAAVDLSTCMEQTLLQCTFVSLTFSTEKNGTRGEAIGHGRSGDAVTCPVLAVARRILHLRQFHAPPTTFLCAVGPTFTPILPIQITRLLRAAVLSNPTPSGLLPSDINAKSLRATGAMALLNRNVDLDRLRLIGRWKSDAVLRYLYVQAHDIMSDYSSLMLAGSDFNLIPTTPDAALPTFH